VEFITMQVGVQPRRIGAGDPVVVSVILHSHLTTEARVSMRAVVVEPGGKKVPLVDEDPLVFPSEAGLGPTRIQLPFQTPIDCPPGRYRVAMDLYYGGRSWYSDTVEEDYFLVEQLHLEAGDEADDTGAVRVVNPSTVAAEAHLVTWCAGKCTALPVTLPPGTTELQISGEKACLRYAENRLLYLRPRDEASVYRNPRLFWLEEGDAIRVYDPGEGPRTKFVAGVPTKIAPAPFKRTMFLTGTVRRLWLSADGTRGVRELAQTIELEQETVTDYVSVLKEKQLLWEVKY